MPRRRFNDKEQVWGFSEGQDASGSGQRSAAKSVVPQHMRRDTGNVRVGN